MLWPGSLQRQGGSVAPEGELVEVGRAGGIVAGGDADDGSWRGESRSSRRDKFWFLGRAP
jgi:hypothetical protein